MKTIKKSMEDYPEYLQFEVASLMRDTRKERGLSIIDTAKGVIDGFGKEDSRYLAEAIKHLLKEDVKKDIQKR